MLGDFGEWEEPDFLNDEYILQDYERRRGWRKARAVDDQSYRLLQRDPEFSDHPWINYLDLEVMSHWEDQVSDKDIYRIFGSVWKEPDFSDILRNWSFANIGTDYNLESPNPDIPPIFGQNLEIGIETGLYKQLKFDYNMTATGNDANWVEMEWYHCTFPNYQTYWESNYYAVNAIEKATNELVYLCCHVTRLRPPDIDEIGWQFSTPVLEKALKDMTRQTLFHQVLEHKNIIQLWEVFPIPDRKTKFPYACVLALYDYIPRYGIGGKLESLIVERALNEEPPLFEAEVWYIFKEIAQVIQYLHQENIAHLNITPHTIHFDKFITQTGLGKYRVHDYGGSYASSSIYLSGFRFAMAVPADGSTVSINSISVELLKNVENWMLAPELINNQYVDLKKCDIYMLGALLAALLKPKNMNYFHFFFALENAMATGHYIYSPNLLPLIQWLSYVGPEDRPTIDQVLRHPWVTTIQEFRLNPIAHTINGMQIERVDDPHIERHRTLMYQAVLYPNKLIIVQDFVPSTYELGPELIMNNPCSPIPPIMIDGIVYETMEELDQILDELCKDKYKRVTVRHRDPTNRTESRKWAAPLWVNIDPNDIRNALKSRPIQDI